MMVAECTKVIANCAICATPSKSKCSNCNQVYYCSVEHQKQDWKKHKPNCHPFAVRVSEKCGRFLMSTRNIKACEIVLKESPLMWGPSQVTGPVCVGCMKGLEESDHLECERCGWPICQRSCQDIPEHKAECELTVARGNKVSIQNFVAPHPTYQCLSTLRCLLLKDNKPEKWERLIQLESHEEERQGSPQWRSDMEGIAKFIPRFFKYNKFTVDEIMKVTGILQINGHEVPLAEPPYVAVYDYASLMEHSCFPNLTKSFSKKGDVIFWAPKDIPKDTSLSICYTDALWGTAARQHHLLQTKLFKCDCFRCHDVTELETYYSALLCNHDDCKGYALPLSLELWEENWKCNTCGKDVDRVFVSDILERAGKDISAMEKGVIENCLRYVNHYSKWLPKTHHFLSEIRIFLSQLIGSGGPEKLQSISNDELMQKTQISREMLELYEKLAPAETRVLGLLSFELHAALAERGRRASGDEGDVCRCSLEESLQYVEKACKYLQYEPLSLSEGQVYRQAKINMDSLKLMMGLPI